MKGYMIFFFTFAILAVTITGCANNEEKTMKIAVSTIETSLSSKHMLGFSQQNDVQQEVVSDKLISNETEQQQKEEAEDRQATISSAPNVTKDESQPETKQQTKRNALPSYQLNIRSGIIAQQRLVEVKLETTKPEQYDVKVLDMQLEYRKEVDLFVGLINSMDDQQITNNISVTKMK